MPRSGRCQIAESIGSEPLHQDMFPEQRRGSVPRGKLGRLLIKPEMSAVGAKADMRWVIPEFRFLTQRRVRQEAGKE